MATYNEILSKIRRGKPVTARQLNAISWEAEQKARRFRKGILKRKKTLKKKLRKKQTKTKILRVLGQTGKRKSIIKDKMIKAHPPSKRKSASGKVYWETRRNRTDKKGSRL